MGLKFKNKKNEVLILKDASSSVAPLIFGLIFLAVGGALSFFGYFSPVLECHRVGSATNCELTRQGLFPFKTHRIILKDFTGAQVKTHDDSDGDTYSIVLSSADGSSVPFANYSSSGYSAKADLVSKIERNLNTQKDFSVKYSQKMLLFVGVFFAAFAVMMLWSGIKYAIIEQTVLEAHFAQGILKIYPYHSSKKYEDARPLSDVQDIRVEPAPKYWKPYALYIKQICELKGFSLPLAVTVMLKASSFLGGSINVTAQGEQDGAKNGIQQNNNSQMLIITLKDSSEVYAMITSYGNSVNAVAEFKKYLGIDGIGS